MSTNHPFKFFRAGGFDQVRLESGADIAALGTLDPKLWVAIACPTQGLELDPRTLAFLDGNADGRVRAPEVIEAARWTCSRLTFPDELREGKDALPLSSIQTSDDEGKRLLASARRILTNLGKPDSASIAPADTADTAAIFGKTLFNGDGVIPVASAGDDADTAKAIEDILACVEGGLDRGGARGVTRATLDTFFAEADTFIAWGDEPAGDAAILPLGDATGAASAAADAVREKVVDFFARTALASMDPRLTAALAPSEAALAALSSGTLSSGSAALAAWPLARVEAGRALPLAEGLNPAFEAALAAFSSACVTPLLGARATLSAADWAALEAKLAPYRAWRDRAPKVGVASLGLPRVKALRQGGARAAIEALIARDEALAPEAEALGAVDKLVHHYVHLAKFLDNFVAFRDFYQRGAPAGFQTGTLYLDGRSFELCVRVTSVDAHAALASNSMACLVYCKCTRDGGKETRTIAAAVTNGDSDHLAVGRNGVFYDRQGIDWDATVVKIIEQPISVRQAFFSPYKSLARFVAAQIERFAGAEAQSAEASLTAGATGVAGAATAPAAPAAPSTPVDIGRFAGIFAAIGLAIGALGTALAAVVTGFLSLPAWQMPIALAGASLAISGPSMLIAAMKLRQRTLGPLLDAEGWAVNARARINIPFGASLTKLAVLPPGAQRSTLDPFADRKGPWGKLLLLALVLAGAAWALNEAGLLACWCWAP